MAGRLAPQRAGTLTILPQDFSKARPGISICARTEARQDTARYSVSRNSRSKDCCLSCCTTGPHGASGPVAPPSPLTGKPEACSVMLLEQQEAVDWAEPQDGDRIRASMHVSGVKCAPQGLNSLFIKINSLFFVMKASVVPQLCRYKGAHALPPCRAAIEELVNSKPSGVQDQTRSAEARCHPGSPRASTQLTPSAAHTRFCSSTCRKGNPEQAGAVSDTAIGSRALPALPAKTESQALCPALPLHPRKQHGTRNSITSSCPGVGRKEDGKWFGQDWSQATLPPEPNT